MGSEEEKTAADDLDCIADKHHPPFCHAVRKGADERRKDDVEQYEHEFKHRGEIGGSMQIQQKRNGDDQQRIVRQRREKLSRHDGVESALQPIALPKVCLFRDVK